MFVYIYYHIIYYTIWYYVFWGSQWNILKPTTGRLVALEEEEPHTGAVSLPGMRDQQWHLTGRKAFWWWVAVFFGWFLGHQTFVLYHLVDSSCIFWSLVPKTPQLFEVQKRIEQWGQWPHGQASALRVPKTRSTSSGGALETKGPALYPARPALFWMMHPQQLKVLFGHVVACSILFSSAVKNINPRTMMNNRCSKPSPFQEMWTVLFPSEAIDIHEDSPKERNLEKWKEKCFWPFKPVGTCLGWKWPAIPVSLHHSHDFTHLHLVLLETWAKQRVGKLADTQMWSPSWRKAYDVTCRLYVQKNAYIYIYILSRTKTEHQ